MLALVIVCQWWMLWLLITIGSGGWFGQGYGEGTQVQLRFLKVRHTDFIFSAMAEEFGLSDQAIRNKWVKLGLINIRIQTRKKRADL